MRCNQSLGYWRLLMEVFQLLFNTAAATVAASLKFTENECQRVANLAGGSANTSPVLAEPPVGVERPTVLWIPLSKTQDTVFKALFTCSHCFNHDRIRCRPMWSLGQIQFAVEFDVDVIIERLGSVLAWRSVQVDSPVFIMTGQSN